MHNDQGDRIGLWNLYPTAERKRSYREGVKQDVLMTILLCKELITHEKTRGSLPTILIQNRHLMKRINMIVGEKLQAVSEFQH